MESPIHECTWKVFVVRYSYFHFFFIFLGQHPCTRPHIWSLEWGKFSNVTLGFAKTVAKAPLSLQFAFIKCLPIGSMAVLGDPRRMGTRQITGYTSWINDCRTGQRWERNPFKCLPTQQHLCSVLRCVAFVYEPVYLFLNMPQILWWVWLRLTVLIYLPIPNRIMSSSLPDCN